MGFSQEWHIDISDSSPAGPTSYIHLVDAIVLAYRSFPEDIRPRRVIVRDFSEAHPIFDDLRLNDIPVQFERKLTLAAMRMEEHRRTCDVRHHHSVL